MTKPRPVRLLTMRMLRFARPAALTLVGLYFAALMTCQWLRLDDFQMVATVRNSPLGDLLLDIVSTRTTPHVRFAFLHHFVLIAFFRWVDESRIAANLLYVATAGAMVGAVALLLRRPRPSVEWLGGFVLAAGVFVSLPTWQTLEFKTAGYLLLAFAAASLLVVRAEALMPSSSGRERAVWCALAIGCVHLAEVTFVVVFLVGLSLALRRALRWRAFALVLSWPFFYWGANSLVSHRPTNLLGHTGSGELGKVIRLAAETLWQHWGLECVLGVTAVTMAAVATWKTTDGDRVRRLASELARMSSLALSGLAAVVLTALSYMWVAERHITFSGLGLAGTTILGLRTLQNARWLRACTAISLACLGLGFARAVTRAPRTVAYAVGRERELNALLALQARVQEHVGAAGAREVLVFVPSWIIASKDGQWLEPSAFGASWSRDAFAQSFSCDAPSCPKVTYFPNFDAYRTRLDEAGRRALCARIATADVVVAASQLGPPEPASCETWLKNNRLVDFE